MSDADAVPTVKVDNARVRVTEWHFRPGARTGHHRRAAPTDAALHRKAAIVRLRLRRGRRAPRAANKSAANAALRDPRDYGNFRRSNDTLRP